MESLYESHVSRIAGQTGLSTKRVSGVLNALAAIANEHLDSSQMFDLPGVGFLTRLSANKVKIGKEGSTARPPVPALVGSASGGNAPSGPAQTRTTVVRSLSRTGRRPVAAR